MSSQTFLWIEDRKGKASYMFWENFMRQLFPQVTVESKKNNSELVKAVKALKDTKNKYIIIFDNSFDNLQVIMEQKLLKQCVKEKENVVMMDIICFEYILLEFRSLIKWIYAPSDEFLEKRKNAIFAREKLIKSISFEEWNYKEIREIMAYDKHIGEHNIEQLAAKLLFDLTRNTGFEVSKKSIGTCWIKSCCEWQDRQADDLCGLDEHRLTIFDKMKSVYEETSLKEQFMDIGLEVIL